MSILGDWDVTIKTPIGSLQIAYSFVERDGEITGRATAKQETVPLTDIVVVNNDGGQRVTWRQTVTKPMRLKLEFDVLAEGDRFSGHSRAGRLPRSVVTAKRHRE